MTGREHGSCVAHVGCRTTASIVFASLAVAACSGGGDGGSGYSLSVTPSSLAFAAEQQGPVPASQTLRASYSGDGLVVGWPAGSPEPSWLDLSLVDSAPGASTIAVAVNTTDLAPGVYSATIRFVTGRSDGTSLVVSDVPVRLDVTRGAFTIAGSRGARITHASAASDLELALTVRTALDATAGAACTWQVTSSAPWLSVTPAAGDLSSDAALVARLDPDGLWALENGTHAATLSFQLAPGCSRTTSISWPMPVALDLRPALAAPPVQIAVDETSTPADLAQTVTVTSNVGTAFAAHAAWSASFSGGWASVAPASGTGTGALALELTADALSSLPAGHHEGALSIVPADARLAAVSVPVSLDLALPILEHVAPYTAWVGREAKVVFRGSGFAGAATRDVTLGAESLTANVVSDTELRATVPAQASPGRLAVTLDNALGIARGGSELVVLPEPGYAATSMQLPKGVAQVALDPERQALLLTGVGNDEVTRLRFEGGSWTTDAVPLPAANGAAVTADGRRVLVFTGAAMSWEDHAIVELDADTLAVQATAPCSVPYAYYTLIAPLNDGRTLLVDADQWADLRWYPGFAQGPWAFGFGVYFASTRLTRDRSRLLVRPRYVDPTSSLDDLWSFDAADGVLRERFVPAAIDERVWDVSADGDRMLDGRDVYDRGFAKLGAIALPAPASGSAAALSPDGAFAYALDKVSDAWVLRRTDVRAASGPYPPDAAPLPLALPGDHFVRAMRVSEDGSTLFLVTWTSPDAWTSTYHFHAVPLAY